MHTTDKKNRGVIMTAISYSIRNTLRMESDAIQEILANLNEPVIEKTIDAIVGCKGKIITSGCGTSGVAARKVAHTLSCIECPSLFLEPADAVHGGLGVVQEGDLVILFSKGGETKEISNLIAPSQIKKAFVIGVTENEKSSLATQSDLFLQVKVSQEPDDFNMLATSSIIATIAIFDAICIAITQLRGFTKEQFSIIHPGGAVGKRLTGKTLYEE